MDTAVFKLYLAKPKLEAVLLPKERIAESLQKHDQIAKDIGVRNLVSGTVWSDERYTMFGAEWFPSWKVVREHMRCLNELNWFQYMQSETFLGLEDPEYPMKLQPVDLDPNTDWIAHIWINQFLSTTYEATEAEKAEFLKSIEFGKTLGLHELVTVISWPINEEWNGWGIELYPSLEKRLEAAQNHMKAQWWKFVSARTFLGTADSGELIKK